MCFLIRPCATVLRKKKEALEKVQQVLPICADAAALLLWGRHDDMTAVLETFPADGHNLLTAATIKGAARSAQTIGFDAMEPVDLVVAGCVAVGTDGARLGKGGGFSDLEFTLAAAAALIGPSTIVATTVHDVQVREADEIPTVPHDVAVDLIATPTRVLRTKPRRRRPALRWEELTDEKIASIPLLTALRSRL